MLGSDRGPGDVRYAVPSTDTGFGAYRLRKRPRVTLRSSRSSWRVRERRRQPRSGSTDADRRGSLPWMLP
eukprot:903556-Rhodomonas_salina.6